MSEVTRRTFVGATAGVAGATALAGGSALADLTGRNDEYSADRFRPHVGSRFRVVIDRNETIEATLSEVEVLGQAPRSEFRAPVSLIFVTGTRVLEQNRYAIHHAELGRLDLMLVPTGKGPNGYEHQVIFG